MEFKNWCRQTIALHRTVPLPGKNPASQGGFRPSSNPVKNASSVFKCPLCSGNHSDKRGRPRKYLAACNSFLEQTVPQRWNTIRRLKLCQVCTSAAEHGKFGENCHLKRLACKCGSENLHHTLLCSSNATHAVASSSSPPDKDSDKGAKPKKNNKSRKKSSKGNTQSSLPQVSYIDGDNSDSSHSRRPDMSVFSERLLLLLHTLFSLSTSSSDSSFRTKCEHHLKDELFSQPLILQCCMETKINLQNKTVSCISLLDNGSTLSFLSTPFIKKFRLSSLGVWRGNVQTLSDTKNVATDFFKLSFQTSSGQHFVLALQTDR